MDIMNDFGKKIGSALDECTVFMALGTSGVVEPAASFVAHVYGRARTIYVGPEEPANRFAFTECYLGKAEEFCRIYSTLSRQASRVHNSELAKCLLLRRDSGGWRRLLVSL
jgi:NAD-dependent SIR2 family protein deacetylase